MKYLLTLGLLVLHLPASPKVREDLQLQDLVGLNAKQAGAIMLEGQTHREIIAVTRENPDYSLPEVQQLRLLERPERIGSACIRNVWTVRFLQDPATGKGRIRKYNPGKVVEVAPADALPCEFGIYFKLVRGTQVDAAIEALTKLGRIRDDFWSAEFDCDADMVDYCSKDGRPSFRVRLAHFGAVWSDGNEAYVDSSDSCFRLHFSVKEEGPLRIKMCPPPPAI